MPYIALLIVVLTGIGIVKKLQVNILLLFAGIALNVLAILGGNMDLLPKGTHSTGFIGFDLFALLAALSKHQVATTGFIIPEASRPTWIRSAQPISSLASVSNHSGNSGTLI